MELTDGTADALARAVAGQFTLEREIGRGGMGVVYLARDVQLHRAVAIKTLPPHLGADPQVRLRFLREARTAAGLSHPNIVPIFSAAEQERVVYFTMGYVQGESLGERISRDGPLSPLALLPIVRKLVSALGYAHDCGVVHRDVKPENVLLDANDRAMVTDFGIARVIEEQGLTATGTVLGTVQYMSPEQVNGEPLDGRSDLYALGVLIFFALSGRFPFERSMASAVLVAHVNSPAPRLRTVLPGVATSLDDLVARLLAKSPDARFASTDDLLKALDAVEETLTMAPEPSAAISSGEAQRLWARAAELQANTGVATPPSPFALRGAADAASDEGAIGRSSASATRGYTPQIVREAAVDAGIDARYVERAFAEREQSGAALPSAPALPAPTRLRPELAAPIVVQRGEALLRRPNPLLGASTKLELSSSFDGELTADELEEVADEIRLVLGEMVTISAVGRSLTVSTGMPSNRQGAMPRFIQIHLASRNGRTTVRAFEDLSQFAGGMFGGLGAGAGVGGSAVVAGLAANSSLGVGVALLAGAATLLTAVGGARLAFVRTSRSRERELERLLRRVVERAKASLPPG